MVRISVTSVLVLVAWIGIGGWTAKREQFPKLKGPYLGQELPGRKPAMFAPGIISTDLHDDFGPAFTPDGKEVFFRCLGGGKMLILHMQVDSDGWGHPQIASFSGEFGDMGVFLNHTGTRLFFSSDRPSDAADTTGDLDIFAVDLTAGGWGEPYCIFPSGCGTGDLFACSIDSTGTIYCYARDSEGIGGFDLYSLKPTYRGYSSKELLSATINTREDETCPCIARDGSFLIYSSNTGTESDGGAGLYVTFLRPDRSWTRPVNLTKHLGMTVPAKFPVLSPDGRYLFFVVPESKDANLRLGRKWDIGTLQGAEPRAGGGNVYWVDISVLDDLRPPKE
jgi:Tol biopolymer transport system component